MSDFTAADAAKAILYGQMWAYEVQGNIEGDLSLAGLIASAAQAHEVEDKVREFEGNLFSIIQKVIDASQEPDIDPNELTGDITRRMREGAKAIDARNGREHCPSAWRVSQPPGREFDYIVFSDEMDADGNVVNVNEEMADDGNPFRTEAEPLYAIARPCHRQPPPSLDAICERAVAKLKRTGEVKLSANLTDWWPNFCGEALAIIRAACEDANQADIECASFWQQEQMKYEAQLTEANAEVERLKAELEEHRGITEFFQGIEQELRDEVEKVEWLREALDNIARQPVCYSCSSTEQAKAALDGEVGGPPLGDPLDQDDE